MAAQSGQSLFGKMNDKGEVAVTITNSYSAVGVFVTVTNAKTRFSRICPPNAF